MIRSTLPRLFFSILFAAAFAFSLRTPLSAQLASTRVDAQREAMHKLSFLVGRWSGPLNISGESGQALHLTQAEDVEYKLDGLVLLIEGKSTNTAGTVLFRALATIAYDVSSHTYRFRAYNDGHYVDTELSVLTDGFSWGFTTGPARIVNSMHLTGSGEWDEAKDVTVNSSPPHRSVNMLLQHLQ